MYSIVLFLHPLMMANTIFSFPQGASNSREGKFDVWDIAENVNQSLENTSVWTIIEQVNQNLGNESGVPVIEFGDIAVNPQRNADPCTAIGCKWPKTSGTVIVPYVISSSYSSSESDVIIQALEYFHQNTCIRFVVRQQQADYLSFEPGTGCWSFIGRQGGAQTVSLQRNGCVYLGTAQHEVLHALGFRHEQSRSDRDSYITILTDNIITSKLNDFAKVQTNNLGTPYDYNSIMHYSKYAFSISPGVLPTLSAKGNPNQVFGEATEMDANDINRVNLLYCRGGDGKAAGPTLLGYSLLLFLSLHA